MNKEIIRLSGMLILMIGMIFAIPLLSYWVLGKFTFNLVEAMEEQEAKEQEEQYQRIKEHCAFDVMQTRYGYECDRPCTKHSLDGKNCVRKGCIDSGFLNLGMECDWYVCEGYGDIKAQCLSHYHGSKEDYCKENPDDEWYCRY